MADSTEVKQKPLRLYNAPKRAFVYRIFSDEALLYVGISKSPMNRFQGHANSPGLYHTSRITLHEYANMDEARAVEFAAILDEAPLENHEDARHALRGEVNPAHLPTIRAAAGMTPDEMASLLGLFPANYALLDNGRRRCSIKLMGRACAFAIERAIRDGVTLDPSIWEIAVGYMQGVNLKPYRLERMKPGRPPKSVAA